MAETTPITGSSTVFSVSAPLRTTTAPQVEDTDQPSEITIELTRPPRDSEFYRIKYDRVVVGNEEVDLRATDSFVRSEPIVETNGTRIVERPDTSGGLGVGAITYEPNVVTSGWHDVTYPAGTVTGQVQRAVYEGRIAIYASEKVNGEYEQIHQQAIENPPEKGSPKIKKFSRNGDKSIFTITVK